MKVNAALEGEAELKRDLGRLKKSLKGRVLLKAARSGANVIRDRGRELAPKKSGKLARRGIVSAQTLRKPDQAEFAVGHHRTYFYGAFQELGVEAGVRKSRTGKRFEHKGHKAQPHLRPAYDEKFDDAVDEARLELRDAVFRSLT